MSPTKTKFEPWKPGDAYNSLNEMIPAFEDQYQYRVWSQRYNKWFYYDLPTKYRGMLSKY